MSDDCAVIRLITLVLVADLRNATVLIAPRTPSPERPPRQITADELESLLLPLVDARAAADALKEEKPSF